ncbi:MAG TPA: nucleotidyltransferase family protein [Pyrinomonadaceae bacterium]|nr:nucleotidyltransferase family protein [Pyrinomonadaceae bacterium]
MDEDLRWHLLMSKTFERQISDAFAMFREQGIEPLLIKGWAASRYYPPDKPRFFTDIDIAVAEDDHERAAKLVDAKAFPNVVIDLHKELRALDTMPWKELMDRSELIETDTGTIRVPCAEDHLRVLCVHWLNDGGAYKNKLWDVYHLIENRRDDLDWNRVLGTVSETRQGWIKTAIAIAHKYLGLHTDDLPFAEEVRTVEPWISRALEKEWATDVRLIPIHMVLRSPRKIFQQIRKRIPPNPIQSTIEMGGRLDARTPIFYQIGNYFQRISPMFERVRYVVRARDGK